MSERWKSHWRIAASIPFKLSKYNRLVLAIDQFIILEEKYNKNLSALSDLSKKDLIRVMLSGAIPASKTHTRRFVIDTLYLMALGKIDTKLHPSITVFLHRTLVSLANKL